MATKNIVKSVIIGCAFLALICWNVILQTKYGREYDRNTRDDHFKEFVEGKLKEYDNKFEEHDSSFKVHKKLINSIDEVTSRRIKRSLTNQFPPTGGATYIRWGRTVCPDDAELVYKGYAGGEYYSHTGGSAEYVCLSGDPKYGRYNSSAIGQSAWIHGVELELYSYKTDTGRILETSNTNLSPLADSDVQCAVCRSLTRTSMIMIPGTNECIPGWNMEYWGYLMTNRHDHEAQHGYACLDKAPEAGTDGGARDDEGAVMYHVQGHCGSLPCKPYVQNYELTCVVCTK